MRPSKVAPMVIRPKGGGGGGGGTLLTRVP